MPQTPWNKKSPPSAWGKKTDGTPFSGATRSPHKTLLNSRRWRNKRNKFVRNHPICEECKRKGITNDKQLEVHHKIAVQDGGDMWDDDNLETLCKRHHQIETNKEINNRKK